MKKWIAILLVFIVTTIVFLPRNEEALSATYAVDSSRLPMTKNLSHTFLFFQNLSFQKTMKDAAILSHQTTALPEQWGLQVKGVKKQLDTDDSVIALTLDACGSVSGNGFDQDLINFLVENNIDATLFINKRWIDENQEEFLYLDSQDQFQIENHGTHHKPLSINGQLAYGIPGTNSTEEVIEEVMTNYQTIYQLTDKQSKYFRSGTAHYDEISVALLNQLGIEVVNFDINGDAGATYSANQVKQSLLNAQPGSIVILHMNQPNSDTAEGVKMAVPLLHEQGFTFVKLSDYQLK